MERTQVTKKHIKGLGRRLVAMFLAMVMCTSMLQLTAFAAESSGKVMDGSYILNADGTIAEKVTGQDHDTLVYEDGVFELTKSAVKTGENQFDVTLKVQATETVTTNAAAIQLVIDTSSSMNYCSVCGKSSCSHGTDNRMTAVKNVLAQDGGFLDSLVTANTGAIYVSVITYGLGAKTVCDWTDIKVASNLASVKSAINGLNKVENATNTQAGLMLARNRLGMSTVANAGVKYTVLLTDGYANTYSSDSGNNSTSTTSISNGKSPSNANETPEGTSYAKDMADDVAKLSTLYAVGYGTTLEYLKKIVANENNIYVGSSNEEISGVFQDIADATVSGMNGAGTSVTDPMGQFIVLDVENIPNGVTANGNGLRWELDPSKAEKRESGNKTIYTYTVTYPIVLDTAAKGFVEDYDYPANGYTYLTVPQDGAEAKKLAFPVPGISGKTPEEDWTIEYYLQDKDSVGEEEITYSLDATSNYHNVKVWTSVNAPEGYEDKYASKDYAFAYGNPTMQIVPGGANVMKLYYNLITEDVTVKHYYKTDYIRADGSEEKGTYPETADVVDGPIVCVVNSEFTATAKPEFNSAAYELDKAPSDELTIDVTKDDDNLIELYYTRLVDERVETSVEVDHVYRTYGYQLNAAGKYVEVLIGEQERVAQKAEGVRATTRFDVSAEALAGYEGYVLNEEEGDYSDLLQENGTLSFIVAEKAKDNVRTLYFDKAASEPEAATVTVNHYYTQSITYVDENGSVQTVVDPNMELNSDATTTVSAYAGEKFTAEEICDYEGVTYTADAGNAAKLVIEALPAGATTIDLYYSRVETPKAASVVANHYWRSFVEVTVEKTEEVTEEVEVEVASEDGEISTVSETVTKEVVVGTEVITRMEIDHKIEDIVYSGLYEGQKYVESQKVWEEAEETYVFNAKDSVASTYAGSDVEIEMYYDRKDTADERRAADITVQHVYTTHLSTIVDGAVDTITSVVTSDLESYTGKAGDEFTATAQPELAGNTYTQVSKIETVILQPGTNATIVIYYEREASDLVETSYNVNHVYKTYTMTVVDGVADYHEAPAVETVSGESVDGYVGERVTLDDGAKDGFTALTTNPATTQTLAASDNEFTFVHEKYIPLEKGSVTVNHYYTLQTIALDGEISESYSSTEGVAVEVTLGMDYTAAPAANGYELVDAKLDSETIAAPYTLTVSGDHVVDFFYEKVVDERETATYTVTHQYFYYDYDGTLLNSSATEPVEFTGYVAHPVTVNPDPTDYELTKVTFNGEKLNAAPYTKYLVDGENAFVFTYEKTKERDMVDVKVIHNYFKDAASMAGENAEVENQYIETVREVAEDSEYTAKEHALEDSAYAYTFHSADPESKTIVAVDDAENVIVMNYVRASAKYQVIHIYNRNGIEEGRTSQTLGGMDGEVVLADSIARVTEYKGNTYKFESITGDITLDADEMQTITLMYNRRVTGGGGGGGGGTIEIPEDPTPLEPAPVPETTPETEPGDDYSEIIEEEVPKAEPPKTGDLSSVWMMMSALSGSALMGMAFMGKKREEEEEE